MRVLVMCTAGGCPWDFPGPGPGSMYYGHTTVVSSSCMAPAMEEGSSAVLYLGVAVLLTLTGIVVGVILQRIWNHFVATDRPWRTTREAEAIRKGRDLLTVIQSPKELATKLYSKGLIDYHRKEKIQQDQSSTVTEQREQLVDAVEERCRVQPTAFQVFINTLWEDPTTVSAASGLQQQLLDEDRPEVHQNQARTQGYFQQHRIGKAVGCSLVAPILRQATPTVLPYALGVLIFLIEPRWRYLFSARDGKPMWRCLPHSVRDGPSESPRRRCLLTVENGHNEDFRKREISKVADSMRSPDSGLPLIRLSGPCARNSYHKTRRNFVTWIFQSDVDTVNQVALNIIENGIMPCDIKVIALSYLALCKTYVEGKLDEADLLFRDALTRAQHSDCVNGELLQGRVLVCYTSLLRAQKRYEEAQSCVHEAKTKFFMAEPSYDKAGVLFQEIQLKLLLKPSDEPTGSSFMLDIEKQLELLLDHTRYFEDYEELVKCRFLACKAAFHLRSSDISHQLPPPQCRPSLEDIRKAKTCLDSVPLESLPSKPNYYAADYYCRLSDLYLWKQEYEQAMKNAQLAAQQYAEGHITNYVSHVPVQRMQLLQRLQEQQNQGDLALNTILDEVAAL